MPAKSCSTLLKSFAYESPRWIPKAASRVSSVPFVLSRLLAVGWIFGLTVPGSVAVPQQTSAQQTSSIESGAGVVEGWTFTLRDQGVLKARFSGVKARPLTASEFDVERLRVETFRPDGEADVVAEAPACRVVFTNDSFVVRSPGALLLRQVDGRYEVDGSGFVWDHSAQNLVVTNRGQTRLRVDLPNPAEWNQEP